MLSLNEQSSVWSCVQSRVRSRVGDVAIKKECLKQLHLIKGRKATNLIFTQCKFNFGSKTNC